ncbi:hypothetical protein N825_01035 [Skermanella stibiiresistens SB22]|uniref:AFP-like domain-containing protein n=1 Tax=Skermanella stibiiresistens SB22 TaxID=1385369 RepID=W9HF33_9PROT|nr:N-acetylneuraminate synthase [Skermanella stibiiresistens]EWY42513.1 hypothetical protein N825_01035 [Skermanella stibiiresistens SB22]
MTTVELAGRRIGSGMPCFVIAEAGVNHNGDLDMALRLIDAAVEAGADAVKFQTFDADRLATVDAPKAAYQKVTTGTVESQHEMLRRLQLDAEAHVRLQRHCAERGILFLSSPFDERAADLLDGLDVAGFKIPSGELTNLPFLAHVAAKRRPIILSTGMADMAEVAVAVSHIAAAGCTDVILLHCLSNYPADPVEANLRAMAAMTAAFYLPVGYSDHTEGVAVALAAVALGAVMIEKHFTLDRTLPGPDHPASLEPAELADLITGIRTVERALGDGVKKSRPSEAGTRATMRKSLVATRDLSAGTLLTAADITAKRPGTGLSPAVLPYLLGRRTAVAVAAGAPIDWALLE